MNLLLISIIIKMHLNTLLPLSFVLLIFIIINIYHLKLDKVGFFLLFVMMFFAITSVIIFLNNSSKLTNRNILQLLYNLSYIILALDINININKKNLLKMIIILTWMMNIILVILWIKNVVYHKTINLDELWGRAYYAGWPNSTIIPFVVGFWFAVVSKYKILSMVTLLSLLIIGSRLALFIIILIVFIYNAVLIKNYIISAIICILVIISSIIIILDPSLMGIRHDLFMFRDRLAVYESFFNYYTKRWFWGYGGNTLDQLPAIIGDLRILMKWPHTHNIILEHALRYGMISTLAFILVLINKLRKIDIIEYKILYIILLLMSLFQNYARELDFVIILFIVSLMGKSPQLKKNADLLQHESI